MYTTSSYDTCIGLRSTVRSNDIMTSYQHHVTAEALIDVYEPVDKISRKSARIYWKINKLSYQLNAKNCHISRNFAGKADCGESCPASRPRNREIDSALAAGWGCRTAVPPSRLCGLGECRELPQRGPGQRPARQRFFGRPFLKRFALRYQTVVCPVCLSVCPVYPVCL